MGNLEVSWAENILRRVYERIGFKRGCEDKRQAASLKNSQAEITEPKRTVKGPKN